MGNACSHAPAVKPAAASSAKQPSSLARSVSQSSRQSGSRQSGLGRISGSLGRISAVVRRKGAAASAAADAANSRHQLEERLAEVIMAKAAEAEAAGAGPRTTVKFNRLLLRFGTLHEGFAACRAAFRLLSGGSGGGEESQDGGRGGSTSGQAQQGELSLDQFRQACTQLGYHADDAALRRIFASVDIDNSSSLNVHEFLVVLAILHILKGPEDEECVDPAILATWRTCEEAFMCFASSRHGYIEKEELMRMMHEGATDGVRHSASGNGTDPIRSIAQRRFAELDRDGRGRVSFLEFLFCLEGWVEDAEEYQEAE